MTDFKNGEFALDVIARGSYLDYVGDKRFSVEVITVRLNCTAMNAWSRSIMMNTRDCYENEDDWIQHVEKYKERRRQVKAQFVRALGIKADLEQLNISQVISEVFTIACISEACTCYMEEKNLPAATGQVQELKNNNLSLV